MAGKNSNDKYVDPLYSRIGGNPPISGNNVKPTTLPMFTPKPAPKKPILDKGFSVDLNTAFKPKPKAPIKMVPYNK